MITLDKLILSVPSNLICWRGEIRGFDSVKRGLPYRLIIRYSNQFKTYRIEFSAKILRDHYPDLINANNVRDCLAAINEIGVCSLDIDGVLRESKVIGADFTRDISLDEIPNVYNMNDLKSIIHVALNNNMRWNCANYRGGGLVIENAVNDRRRKKRLTVYDKGSELELASNKGFLRWLEDSDRLKEYFRRRVRFELRATTQYQLRQWLGVRDCGIMEVLCASANPLQLIAREMFYPIYCADDSQIKPTLTNLDKLSTLKLMDWDLSRVEAHVRESTNRSIKEGMKPYIRLFCAHKISKPVDIVDFL